MQQMQETPTLIGNLDDSMQQQYLKTKTITHVIQKFDTLEGLAVQYGLTIESIRKFNNLTTNQIYHLKTILIPDPKAYDIQQEPIPDGNSIYEQFIKEYFYNQVLDVQDQSYKIADYYLKLCEGNLQKAIYEYQQDKKFDK